MAARGSARSGKSKAPASRRSRTAATGATSPARKEAGERTGRLFEWVLAGVSALLVAALVGFLILEALDNSGGPARLESSVISIEPSGSRYLVRFTMTNSGDATAASVLVEGELSSDGEVVETTETTFDYIPAQSQRDGALLFSINPATSELSIVAKGYKEP